MGRPLLLVLALVVLSLAGRVEVSGQESIDEMAQYHCQTWGLREGLPQSSVSSIVQTPDGYLWLGTQEGLARFDGIQFRVFNKKNAPFLQNNFVRLLFVDADSSLWVASDARGLLRARSGGFAAADTLLSGYFVTAIVQDSTGTLWVGTRGGKILRGDRSGFEALTPQGAPRGLAIIALETLADGGLLVGTNRGLFSLRDGRLERSPLLPNPYVVVRMIRRSVQGDIWVGTNDDGLWQLSAGAKRHFARANGLPSNRVLSLMTDGDGNTWVGTLGGGVVRIRKGRITRFSTVNGLSNDDVVSLCRDHEGSLWAGTSGGGLNRLTLGKFATFPAGNSPTQGVVTSVYQAREGALWAGNGEGQLLRFNGARFEPVVQLPGGERRTVAALMEDHAGTMWIGTSQGVVLYRDGSIHDLSIDASTPPFSVSSIVQESGGGVLLGTSYGVKRFWNGRLSDVTRPANGSETLIRSLATQRDGTIWAASWGAGLFRVRGGRIDRYTTSDGLPTNDLMSLHLDRQGSLWIGTLGHGLARYRDGHFRTYTAAQGLFDDVVYAILEDDSSRLWMSSNNGVFAVKVADLDAFDLGGTDTITCWSFGINDGMRTSECNGIGLNSGWRSSDGRLWFATIRGVASVDPNNVPRNTVPPPVVIEDVVVDRQSYLAEGSIVAPPGSGQLEIHYVGLSYLNPTRVRYLYKLEGFDDAWVDADARRSAFYTNLPPGRYRFDLRVANSDGIWNQTGASILLTLEPHFYQTTWFLLLCIAVAAASGFRGFQLYRRYHERELRSSQLEASLARAKLQALAMQLQPHFLFNTLHAIQVLVREDPEVAGRMITGLSELLRMTLDEGGQELVPLARELEFLSKYVEIQEIRFQDRLRVDVDVKNELLPALVPTMILQPLVENAITHGVTKRAGPGRIEVTARLLGTTVELRVVDDGTGAALTPAAVERSGVGITNTMARLRQMYGDGHQFSINSQPGRGTEVRIVLPLRYEGGGTTSVEETPED